MSALRKLLRRLVPVGYRSQAIADRWVEKATADTVVAGPFAGMRYLVDPAALCLPKLLGSYEKELSEVIEQLAREGYRRIVNVGAAEGYYAVGLARAIPEAAVLAFEADPKRQRLMVRIAELNGVADRLEIRGACDTESLAFAVGGNEPCLVVIDVEGAEATLLDPSAAPGLEHCTMLAELHPHAVAGIDGLVRTRFERTHVIEEVLDGPRTWKDFPLPAPAGMRLLFREALVNTMNERRPGRTPWFVMRPRTGRPIERKTE